MLLFLTMLANKVLVADALALFHYTVDTTENGMSGAETVKEVIEFNIRKLYETDIFTRWLLILEARKNLR